MTKENLLKYKAIYEASGNSKQLAKVNKNLALYKDAPVKEESKSKGKK